MPWRVPRRLQCTPWWGLLLALSLLGLAPASAAPAVRAAGSVTIAFGQEMGNIRPFNITIGPSGAVAVTAGGPVHLNSSHPLTHNAVAGLVLLARAEGFRALPAFTACPGALPDIAARYVEIRTAGWRHRASARGSCVPALNQLFAVLMAVTHASF